MSYVFKKNWGHKGWSRSRQKGALTMISAVLILILLTELIIYAVQVGIFEQRKSSNEMRQKEAFHVAESAIQFSKEYLLANSTGIASAEWLAARWKPCSNADLSAPQGTHPCYGEPADNTTDFPADLRSNMYFWDPGEVSLRGSDPYGHPTLPIDVGSVIADEETETRRVHVYALLCMLHIERDAAARTIPSPVQGCTTDASLQNPAFFMITLMARGEADCDGGECSARALITDKVGSFGPAAGEGGPTVPLTSRSTLPPSGTSEIVPNPNGGGVGVPVSAWISQNPNCPYTIGAALDPDGDSWATCEAHEWYGTDMMPEDFRCPERGGCECGEHERRISERGQPGPDLVDDPLFPCDLWQYVFNVPKYVYVDGEPTNVINEDSLDYIRNFYVDHKIDADDCDTLGPDSGEDGHIWWIEGGACNIAGNTEVGSPENPVLIISAAEGFSMGGGAVLFGTLFITDALLPESDFTANGTATIYGAVVVDTELDQFGGTYQVVYVENLISRSLEVGKFGSVAGGWSDFHSDWR